MDTAICAVVTDTAGAHPARVPVSVAKMTRAGAAAAPDETTKSALPLKTCPVGAPPGTWITKGVFAMELPFTSPAYSSLTPLPLAETPNVPPAGFDEIPQALTSIGSRIRAPTWSETRLVC